MKIVLRFACLSCFATLLCLGGNSSGWLVRAKCFASLDDNRNAPRNQWDESLAIRYCTPDKDTNSFALVKEEDESPFYFDSAGNKKAAELPLSIEKDFVYFVRVATEVHGNTIEVRGISIVQRVPRNGRGAPGL